MPNTFGDFLQQSYAGKLLIIGESHDVSENRRTEEIKFVQKAYGIRDYHIEFSFPSGKRNTYGNELMGDPAELSTRSKLLFLERDLGESLDALGTFKEINKTDLKDKVFEGIMEVLLSFEKGSCCFDLNGIEDKGLRNDLFFYQPSSPDVFMAIDNRYNDKLLGHLKDIEYIIDHSLDDQVLIGDLKDLSNTLFEIDGMLSNRTDKSINYNAEIIKVGNMREQAMFEAAITAVQNGLSAVWKVGDRHIMNFLAEDAYHINPKIVFKTEAQFNQELKGWKKTQDASSLKRSLSLKSSTQSAKLLNRRNSI